MGAKRQIVTIQFYEFEATNERAYKNALKVVQQLNADYDCRAEITEMREGAFGVLGTQEIGETLKLNTMTENELKGLGFELTQQYEHDQYHTNRYAKGVLEVEFTYEAGKLLTCDLTIQELNSKPVTLDEIKALTPILGKWQE